MKSLLTILGLLLLAGLALADTPVVATNMVYASAYTSPTTLAPTNAVFTQYGFRTTNENGTVYTWGLSAASELDKCPPEQFTFDFTGTNFELIVSGFSGSTNGAWSSPYFTVSDGINTTSYTNVPAYVRNNALNFYTMIRFTSNVTHHVTINLKGGFLGLDYTNGSFAPTVKAIKPNLLIDEGDSYVEGYNPTVTVNGSPSFWFDGFIGQLPGLQSNLVTVACSMSGTGFYTNNNNGSPTYGQRATNDVCALYTNALASGQYNKIFICANGTINDGVTNQPYPTNAVFSAATNTMWTLKNLCPQATVFMIGNWLGAGGETSPGATDYALENAMTNAAASVGLPIFDPIPANLKNAGNYSVFYPAGTDSVHPSAAGYAIYANWIQTNMVNTFGTNWTMGTGGPGGSGGGGGPANLPGYYLPFHI